MNRKKPSARRYAEIAVRDYLENREAWAALRGEALHGLRAKPEVAIYSEGRDRDDTGRRCIALSSIPIRRLEEDLRAVRYAIGLCGEHRDGAKMLTIIKAVYWDRKNPRKKYQVAMDLGIAQETAGRLANRFLDWVSLWYTVGEGSGAHGSDI